MSSINDIDVWLLRDAYSPTLLIIGLGGLFGLWIAAPMARLFVNKWFGGTLREFSDHFNSQEQTMMRKNFRWNVERAYRKFDPEAKSGDLPSLFDKFQWPDNFPPSEDIANYANNVNWPDEDGKQLWDFLTVLFDDAIKADNQKKLLKNREYSDLMEARFVVSKFWNIWGFRIKGGQLNATSISDFLISNKDDIKALALAELVIEGNLGWDHSRGKTGLFLLAHKHTDIINESWVVYWRKKLGGLFLRIGKRLGGG